MIRLTRLNREPIVVNADVIAFIEQSPDTLVTLLNGDKLHVREPLDEVISLALEYQRRAQVKVPGLRVLEEDEPYGAFAATDSSAHSEER